MPSRNHRAFIIAAFALAIMPGVTLLAQSGATVSGVHANEVFCKTLVKQGDLAASYMASNPGLRSDKSKQAKYFADQKALNAVLVKTAPSSLTADVALFTKNANASYDAQLTADRASMRAAISPMRSPANLTAARHATEYCGVRVDTSK